MCGLVAPTGHLWRRWIPSLLSVETLRRLAQEKGRGLCASPEGRGRGRSPSLTRVGVVGTTMRPPETTVPVCSEDPQEPRLDRQNWILRREGVGAGPMK